MAKSKSNSQATKKSAKNNKVELPKFVPASISADYATSKKWIDLAQKTQQLRHGTDLSSINKTLATASEEDKESPTSPVFQIWRAENFAMHGHYNEAIKAFDIIINNGKINKLIPTIDVKRHAMHQQASMAALSGQVDLAISLWKNQLSLKSKNAESMLAAGRFAEGAGRLDDAVIFYKSISNSKPLSTLTSHEEFAKRALLRMNSKTECFFLSVGHLRDKVVRAIEDRDLKSLDRILSSTHFSIGCAGGHYHFADSKLREKILFELASTRGKICRSMTGGGEKYYLFLNGWNGKLLKGDIGFFFTKSAAGWQWTGIISNSLLASITENIETNVNTAAIYAPLPFTLKAPWPAGRYFEAGGLPLFIIQEAAVLAVLVAIPWPFGPIVAAGLTFGYSTSNCGFGPRGYYYNGSATHENADHYAIDFTRYRQYVPYDNESGGTPILAPAGGIVHSASGTRSSGDSSIANYVEIMHPDPLTNSPRYLSRYLHLDGPNLLNVSILMPVFTGRRLGLLNDTGNSAFSHLHFSLHDQNVPYGDGSKSSDGITILGTSIPPSPMDGTVLGDNDSGVCVYSTNKEIFPPPPDDAEFVNQSGVPEQVFVSQTFSVTITMRNIGPNVWSPDYKLVGPLGWNRSGVTIGRSVAPNSEIAITFDLFATNIGDYRFKWQMSHMGNRFGEVSPYSIIKAIGKTTSCDELRRLIEGEESMLETFQDMLSEFPGDKATIIHRISDIQARIRALETQKNRLGCS